MDPDQWFSELAAALPGDPAPIDRQERAALLDLARVAAHTSERWTAPVSTFLAGLALAGAPPDERTAALQRLIQHFEDPDSASPPGAS